MKARKALLVGALVAALAVPAGVAVAASTPSPGPGTGTGTGQPAWPGGGHDRMQGGMMGGMMGGPGMTGDGPADCPFHDTDEMRQWRDLREERAQLAPQERQDLMRRHHDRMGDRFSPGTEVS